MIKVEKVDENSLVIESDDLTMLTLLNEYLWNTPNVDFCGVEREHIFLKNPKLVLKAKDPKHALEKAREKILEDIEKLRKKISKV
ncbi:MAG: RpoL/Rpb11 RNA polymerase subunit family protein [Candidatus Aenigmatarchaeota archaeon]